MEKLINKEQLIQIILKLTYNLTKQENSRDFSFGKAAQKMHSRI